MRITVLFLLSYGLLPGQSRQRPAHPPRVNPDLSVTYFIDVDAESVFLADTVSSPGPPGLPMTKGPDGIWSVTTPPYQPGTYEYGFVLDGVLSGDAWGSALTDRLPRNSFPFEMIDVRGSDPLFHDLQPVPHGAVHIETLSSPLLGRE